MLSGLQQLGYDALPAGMFALGQGEDISAAVSQPFKAAPVRHTIGGKPAKLCVDCNYPNNCSGRLRGSCLRGAFFSIILISGQ
jgi:hypothetical protein